MSEDIERSPLAGMRGKSSHTLYRTAKAETEIDGVQVEVTTTGRASEDEIAAWCAEQDQAAAGESESPSGGAR